MNVQVVRRWLSELARGRYAQGFSSLRTNDCFCTWGVLCDLHRQEFKGGWVPMGSFKEKDGKEYVRHEYLACSATPAPRVLEWAGLEWQDLGTTIFALNDAQRKTLPEIARILTKKLLPWDDKVDQLCYSIYESSGAYPVAGPMQDFLTLKVGGRLADLGVMDIFERHRRPGGIKPFEEEYEKMVKDFRKYLVEQKSKVVFGYCEWHELNRLVEIIDRP